MQLTVNSVLSSPNDALKDLRPPADLATPLWEQPIVVVLIVIVALGLLGIAAFVLHRRSRRVGEPPVATPDLRTPREVAAEELDRIASLDLPGRGDLKEHYTLVAAVLRRYLGATYLQDTGGLNADDMSTEEIAAAIWQSALDLNNARLVIELLREAELVKFANHEPDPARANEATVQVRNIVEATRPPAAQARGGTVAAPGAAP